MAVRRRRRGSKCTVGSDNKKYCFTRTSGKRTSCKKRRHSRCRKSSKKSSRRSRKRRSSRKSSRKSSSRRSGRKSSRRGRKSSPWIRHVKAYAKQHNISYGDALKKARSTYKG